MSDQNRMEEAHLIREVLSGRRESFAPLVRRHEARVRTLCLALLRDGTEAEDASQEIFLKAYRNLRQYKADAAFSTWLHRIAHNHCLDLLKSRKRRPRESLDALLEKGDGVLGRIAEGPSALTAGEAESWLADLAPEYRLVLALREVQGFTYEEIAGATGVSLDSVKARLRRARQALLERARHFLDLKVVKSMETQNEPRNA